MIKDTQHYRCNKSQARMHACTHACTHAHTHACTHTHTQPFYGPLGFCLGLPRWAGTKKVSQSGFTGASDSEWQWHQLGHTQICTFIQTQLHKHPATQFFTGRMPLLLPNQQRQSTEGMV